MHCQPFLLIFKDYDTLVAGRARPPPFLYCWCRDFIGKAAESTTELIPGLFTANVLFYSSRNNSGKFGTSHSEIIRGRFVPPLFPPPK